MRTRGWKWAPQIVCVVLNTFLLRLFPRLHEAGRVCVYKKQACLSKRVPPADERSFQVCFRMSVVQSDTLWAVPEPQNKDMTTFLLNQSILNCDLSLCVNMIDIIWKWTCCAKAFHRVFLSTHALLCWPLEEQKASVWFVHSEPP